MRKFKKSKAVAALSMAAAVGMYGHVAHGVLVTQYYVTAEISTTSDFSANVSTVTLSQGAPAISMTTGEYMQFGLADVLTNNAGTGPVTNPVSGDAWDKQNQKDGGAAAPTALGLSTINYDVLSSDTNGAKLQPVLGPQFGTNPGNNQPVYHPAATSLINANLISGSQNNGSGVTAGTGDEEKNTGSVGTLSPVTVFWAPGNVDVFGKNGPQESKGGVGIPWVGYFSGANSSLAAATTMFGVVPGTTSTGLSYEALSSGTVTLTPQFQSQFAGYWTPSTLGTTGATAASGFNSKLTSDPSYIQASFGGGDSVAPLAPLVITISSASAAGPVIYLTSGATPPALDQLVTAGSSGAHKGVFAPASANNILMVTGSNQGYVPGTVTGINGGAGDSEDYVQIGGFNPSSDPEYYALNVDNNGSALSPSNNSALIATIVADINAANDATFGLSTASGPQLAYTGSTEPNAGVATVLAGYDIYINIPNAYLATLTDPAGTEYNFGFNFSGYTDGSIGDVTVPSLAVVPEPGAMMGVLSMGALGLFSYRKRKPEPKEVKA